MARLMVGGWAVTWVVMSETKNKTNEVGNRVGGVGGNASGQSKQKRLVGSEQVGVLVGPVNRVEGVVVVVEVDGDRGRGKAAVAVMWSVRNDTERKKKKNISKSTRPSSSSSCVLQRHGVGAELSRGRVLVVEVDGDRDPRAYELTCGEAAVTWSVRNNTKRKKNTCRSCRRQPGSWGVSHGGVMVVEDLRQWRGLWVDVWQGGDIDVAL
ncbi:hypothetical protein EDB83DRAFT_2311972 [Lactarius deliciosus]|nr:hypothetical protein EDB83DRAFT_2311972 [Lactarius deliciosus]